MSIDAQVIYKIARSSPTAEVLFGALVARERDRGVTDLKRLRMYLTQKGKKVVKEDMVNTFLALENAGVGKMLYTKGTKQPDRFQWYESMKRVAQIGVKGADSVPPPDQTIRPVSALAKADNMVETILNNLTMTDAQKIQMLKAYFGL